MDTGIGESPASRSFSRGPPSLFFEFLVWNVLALQCSGWERSSAAWQVKKKTVWEKMLFLDWCQCVYSQNDTMAFPEICTVLQSRLFRQWKLKFQVSRMNAINMIRSFSKNGIISHTIYIYIYWHIFFLKGYILLHMGSWDAWKRTL